jgi:D-alanyl-D-alanine carboxypeptidase
MSLFLAALSNGRLLKHETAKLFVAPRADPGGGAGTYGYGFSVQTKPQLRVGHGGGAPGVNAEIALYPDSGWQLIALSNNDPPAASRMVSVLEHAVFAVDTSTGCAEAIQGLARTPPTPPQH